MTPNGTRIRHRVRHARLAGVAFVCAALLVPAAGADAAKCTKKGGKGVDVLKGTKKKDVLCGKGGDDILIGKGGNDVLKGAAGADTLTGKSGNDKLAGGAGDDTLAAGAGNDSFNGGPGIDVAALADSKSAVTVDLGAGTASGDGQDTVAAVENVIGSPVADTLIGDAAANELSAGDGDDTVQGAGGDDVLEGQGGTDSTSYAAAGGPVAADLRAGTVTGEGSDAISGIENLTGSPHADKIIGDDAANVLDGGPGSDTASFAGAPAGVEADLGFQSASGDGQDTLLGFEHLSGSAHGDKLIGDGAANALAGGAGNDTLTGLGGNDALQGGGGSDNAAYGSAPGPINADLRASSVTGEGNDALGSVEGIIGSPHGDTLAGDANSNRLDGAGGTDTVSFAGSPALVDAGLGTGVVTGDGADTLLSVENAIGSSHDDSIAGTAGDNAIAGGPGNDTIAGEAGDDQISGENGNDRLFGAEEDDSIFGGAGDDLLDGGGGANECDGGTGVNTFAGNCDGTAPALTAFAISPTSIDTAAQSRTVGFTLTLTDDAAGVDPAASRVIVHGPSGDPTFSGGVERVSGNDLNGDYTAAIQLPRFSAQGMWTVEVQLADQSGNSVTITTAQLATAGRPNSFHQTGAGDDSGPVLTALSRNPTSIDTNAAPVDVNFDFTITDDPAGVDPAASRVIVHGPGGQPTFEVPLQHAGGDNYTATVTIPRYSAPGNWTVELLLVDTAANESFLDTPTLNGNGYIGGFTQTGAGDTAPPLLTAFGRSPAQINTAEVDQNVNFTLTATDNLSGVDPAASRVLVYDPVNQPRGESPLNPTGGNGYSAAITIPQGSATGTWRIEVELVDAVGNREVVTTAELAAAGFPSTFQNVAPSGT